MTQVLSTEDQIKSLENEICQLEDSHPSVEEPMPSFANMDPEDDTCGNLIIPGDQTVVHSWVLHSEVHLHNFEFTEFAKSLCTSQGHCRIVLETVLKHFANYLKSLPPCMCYMSLMTTDGVLLYPITGRPQPNKQFDIGDLMAKIDRKMGSDDHFGEYTLLLMSANNVITIDIASGVDDHF